MATGDYCTLDELKRQLWPAGEVPDDAQDDDLESLITAVSREIRNYTGTRFHDTGSDETRYYTAQDGSTCWIDPFTSITSVATDEALDRNYSTSWTVNTHYEVWPYNYSERGLPIARIDRVPLSDLIFPTTAKAVKVVGRAGWDNSTSATNTIADVKRACRIQAARLFKRDDSPFGMVAVGEGQIEVIPGLDPDVKRILDTYRLTLT